MKARSRQEKNTTINFDLTAPIKPLVGLSGLSFAQTIKDFKSVLINKSLDDNSGDNFNYYLDSKYFYLTLTTTNYEVEVQIDLISGKIDSMTCSNGYVGKLDNGIGIGSSIKTALAKDATLYFNLDTDWFNRTPFDGLIIYAPNHVRDKCIDAAVYGSEFPDFNIETIELIDLDFAKEHFSAGQLDFKENSK